MVEFAIVLPVLVAVIFGMTEFGVIPFDQAVITNASRQAVRKGALAYSVYRTGNPADLTAVQALAVGYCYGLISLGSGASACTAVASRVNAAGTALSGPPQTGDILTVSVSYTYHGLLLPLVPNLNLTLTAKETMTYE
jgi:Flp pilus assembly protein TadG